MDHRFKCMKYTIKLSKLKTGVNIYDLGLGHVFVDMTIKAQVTTEK